MSYLNYQIFFLNNIVLAEVSSASFTFSQAGCVSLGLGYIQVVQEADLKEIWDGHLVEHASPADPFVGVKPDAVLGAENVLHGGIESCWWGLRDMESLIRSLGLLP
jgi:hypothetical protein